LFTPMNQEPQEWEVEFDKTFDQYNPVHDDGVTVPPWNGGDYIALKDFIRSLISSYSSSLHRELVEIWAKIPVRGDWKILEVSPRDGKMDVATLIENDRRQKAYQNYLLECAKFCESASTAIQITNKVFGRME
jgi:hypothetical protein